MEKAMQCIFGIILFVLYWLFSQQIFKFILKHPIIFFIIFSILIVGYLFFYYRVQNQKDQAEAEWLSLRTNVEQNVYKAKSLKVDSEGCNVRAWVNQMYCSLITVYLGKDGIKLNALFWTLPSIYIAWEEIKRINFSEKALQSEGAKIFIELTKNDKVIYFEFKCRAEEFVEKLRKVIPKTVEIT